jgi:hypothetical protein
MPSVDITHQPIVVEATNDTSVVSFSDTQVVVEVPNPAPVVEFASAATLVPGAGLTGGGYLLGNVAIGLSPASVASLLKADTAVQPGANLSGFVDDVGLATDAEVAAAIAALSAIYQPVNSNLTEVAALSTTVFGRSFLTLANEAAARTLIGVYSTSEVLSLLALKANVSHTHTTADITGGISWSNLTGVPATFPPGAHTHVMADLTDYVAAGTWGSITGTLSAQTDLQAALDGKAATGHTHSYLPLAGGLMTGSFALNFHTLFGIGNTNDTFTYDGDVIPHYGIRWYSDTEFESQGPTAAFASYGGIRFFTLGTLRAFISPGGDLATNRIYPIANNTYTLGSPSYYWSAVYGISFVENGTALSAKYAAIGHTHTGIASLTSPFHSGSDFPDGTLVATDIDASVTNGASFVIEITGKSYSDIIPPTKVVAQGYLYNDTIINASALSYGGTFASSIKLMNDGGVLKVWWPNVGYWHSYNVRVYNATGATDGNVSRNRVTGITNAAEPTGSKKITVTVQQSLYTWGGQLLSGVAIKANSHHITLYEGDGPDPNDRVLFEVNGGQFNLYTHDNSLNQWWLPFSANIQSGQIEIGGNSAASLIIKTGNLVTRTSEVTGYQAYQYSGGTLSHYMAFNSGDYGFLNEAGNWSLRLDRSKNVYLSRLVIDAPSNTGIPALGASSASNSFLIRFSGDPLYGMLMGVIGSGDGWIQVQRIDAQATAYDLLLQPNGGLVKIGGNVAFHAGNVGTAANIFWNNMGGTHGDTIDFNDVAIGFGPKFLQSTTNGPGTGASQWYTMNMGLGINYPNYSGVSAYRIQLAWPRTGMESADKRAAFRTMEAGSWTAWNYHAMSNYDSQFSVAQTFNSNINIGGSFYRTSGAEFSFFGQGSDTVYMTLRGGATPVMRGYIYGDGDGFGLLGNTGAWSIRIAHGTGGGIMLYNTTFFGGASNKAANNDGFYVNWSNSRYITDANVNYGSADVHGSKGGWAGFRFASAAGSPHLMFTTSGQTGGIYNESGLGWILYFTGAHWQGYGGQALAQMSTSASCIIRRGTAAPSGGVDGDLYLQYT